ncbi:MAG: hypothetical protein OEO77_13905, partial [Acidimicrobiia bacterium]|nr:hypothetical protein [Acidimicrobiia bacterium]
IELPYWLVLSPSIENGQWDHSKVAKEFDGRTELWHTSLDTSPIGGFLFPALRAVWTRDWDGKIGDPETLGFECSAPAPGYPFAVQSLTPRDRADIVISTAHFKDLNGAPTVPRPLRADRLMLSSLGGWLDVTGEFETQVTGRSLESWIHRATGGRDHYVRVVRTGFLFPLGHRAVKITVTERKPGIPGTGAESRAAAYLRQREFIVVRQPTRTYGAGADPHNGRGFPFTSVRMITSTTPDLDPEATSPLPSTDPINPEVAYVPSVAAKPFLFEMVGTDHEGREIPFASPLVWVDGSSAQAPGCLQSIPGNDPPNAGAGIYETLNRSWIVKAYNLLPAGPIRTDVPAGGRPAALAPSVTKGSTTFDLKSFRLLANKPQDESDAKMAALFAAGEPPFYPTLEQAELRLAAAEIVSGAASGWTAVTYDPPFVSSGFGPGEVFARIAVPKDVSIAQGGRGGGIATPNLKLTGLSRKLGVFGGDPTAIGAGTAPPNPCDLFSSGAQLLGGIDLCDVVALPSLAEMPVLQSSLLSVGGATIQQVVLDWQPELKADPGKVLGVAGNSDFFVKAVYRRNLDDPTDSSSLVTGELRNVAITLVPETPSADYRFVKITFSRVSFKSEDDKKTEIKVDIGNVEFLGAMRYLAKLADAIQPPDGTPTGPYLDVSPARVTAGLAFALPAVQVGAFVLENISFLSEIRLPLNGDPVTARFGFSTRQDPFHLTVLALGGGGFAAIEVGADGPKALDVSLEAGAMIALNLGVAKGKVEAFAGLYFRLAEENGKTVSIYEVFVRIGGSLRLLGLVTVSTKIYLSMQYDTAKDKFHGSAKLTYSIDLGFFEKDVSFTVSRKFGRDSGDPFVTDRFTSDEWQQYCTAFAAVEAS